MTIAVSIRVGEGLVYAADSTSTMFTTVNNVSVLAQSFHHAQKLMEVGHHPIGVLTFGLGLLGTRNLESLLTEFELEVLPQVQDSNSGPSVKDVAAQLQAFLADRYDQAFPPPSPPLPGVDPPPDPRPAMGVVVGGYSGGSFAPEEYVLLFPSRTLEATRQSGVDFGVRWWGQTDALQRLLLGFDAGLMHWLADRGVEQAALPAISAELTQRFGWNIGFDGMPLQDAIDLAVYLTNVVIGQSRFAMGPPVCGGPVDVATISHLGFRWIRRKELRVKSDSTFF